MVATSTNMTFIGLHRKICEITIVDLEHPDTPKKSVIVQVMKPGRPCPPEQCRAQTAPRPPQNTNRLYLQTSRAPAQSLHCPDPKGRLENTRQTGKWRVLSQGSGGQGRSYHFKPSLCYYRHFLHVAIFLGLKSQGRQELIEGILKGLRKARIDVDWFTRDANDTIKTGACCGLSCVSGQLKPRM